MNSTATAQGTKAEFDNSAAFGAGATATRANQQVFGTINNTYTFGGITSDASRAAQTGTFRGVVTTDANGNLASDNGAFQQQIGLLEGRITGFATQVAAVETQVDGVDQRVTVVEGRATVVDERVTGIDTRVRGIDTRVTGVETQVIGLDGQVKGLDRRVDGLEERVDGIDGQIGNIRGQISGLQGQIDDLGRRDRELADGIAIALAIQQPIFQPGQSFAIRAGYGNFDGNDAFGLSAAGVSTEARWAGEAQSRSTPASASAAPRARLPAGQA